MITKENQIKFYTEELKEIEFSVKKTFNSLALSLFQNGEILVGQYKGFDPKRGNVFVDIPIGQGYHSPRLDQKFTCFTLAPGLERPTKWTDISYVELLKDRNRTDTKIIDFTTSKREGWITMLIREIDSEFVDSLQYNQILGLGPVIPPYEYIENLLTFSKGISFDQGNIWNDILSFKYRSSSDNYPILLTEEIDIPELIIEKVDKSRVFILQGPPGTGKTHQIADLVSRLVNKGNSVLLTALTNKAALEVCTKSFFDKLFDLEKICKLPLLLDEKRRFPKLLATDNLLPVKGHLNLTTYYQFSKIWTTQTQTYDYVIVEEASQAFLTTIAAACKVGKKVIIIGDPKQIVPIVSNKGFNKIPNVSLLVNGMQTVSNIDDFSYYRKIETRRLTKRACMFTNSFYENTMVAKSLIDNLEQEIEELHFLKQYIPNQGGPVLVRFKNVNVFEQMIEFLVNGINELSGSGKNEIAVLTPYVDTLKILQQNLKQKTVAKNFLIESVDRVQGLDVDYCFYVVAKSSSFSFDTNRFNVATSRAKKATFILVEEDFDKLLIFSNEVVDFLEKFKKESN